jgi:hypothetical protein
VNYTNWSCAGSEIPIGEFGTSNKIANAMAQARTAAVNRAATNNFTIDQDISDFHGVRTQCTIYNFGSYVDKYIDITVWITTNTQGNFSRFLFSEPLQSRVQSVTRVRPRMPLAFGYAIVALNPNGCSGQTNGATYHGNADMTIHGSGIFSNGCLRSNSNASVIVEGGAINYVSELVGGGAFSPAAVKAAAPLPQDSYKIPKPDCSHPDAHNVSGSEMLNTDLEPGLYCVTGDLRVNANDTMHGTDITIYMVDGEVRINGSATLDIHSPGTFTDPHPAIPGVLFYMAPGNDSEVEITGNSESTLTGTVYAPESQIIFLGNGNNYGFETQLIGWNVEAGGTSEANLWYCSCTVYSKPTAMDLSR